MERNERALLITVAASAAAALTTAGLLLKDLAKHEAKVKAKNAKKVNGKKTNAVDGLGMGDLFFSPTVGRWHVCAPVDNELHIIPLDAQDPANYQEAAQEAAEFVCGSCPERKSTIDGGLSPHVAFEDNRWLLWHPCDRCSGCAVVLADDCNEDEEIAVRLNADEYERVLHNNPDDCPGCIARVFEDPDYKYEQPAVWYDPKELSWQLSIPTYAEGITVQISLSMACILVDEADLQAAVTAVLGNM